MKDDNKNLIPAVIQDADSGEVLMLAYMSRQSLEKSIETGTTWFWSRSKNRLWNKGETSGNIQKIIEIKSHYPKCNYTWIHKGGVILFRGQYNQHFFGKKRDSQNYYGGYK